MSNHQPVTARPDGLPHAMPVLSVWLDGALYFCAGAATRKARNLARNAHCVITTSADDLDGWDPMPRDGAFYGEGAPTAGPSPLDLYEVAPRLVFGFGTTESLNPMRWTF